MVGTLGAAAGAKGAAGASVAAAMLGGGGEGEGGGDKPKRSAAKIKDQAKLERQMKQRGWTYEDVEVAIEHGQRVPAKNNLTGTSATRYVHPKTGRSVVIDDATGGIIQVGGDGFIF